jgi:hypothetical protein
MENLEIQLTPDQEELINELDIFLYDTRLYFGVYGPAGSGKSFTIGYFIKRHNLYDKVLLSGTTNNACRVLEQSLEKSKNINFENLIEKIMNFQSNISINILNFKNTSVSQETINNEKNINDYMTTYLNNIYNYLNELKLNIEQLKLEHYELKDNIVLSSKTINIKINNFKIDIKNFINSNCNEEIKDKINIKFINIIFENLFNSSKYIKTIHSLLCFTQSRDEKHNIVFLPSKSIIEEKVSKTKKQYEFYPKLSGRKKLQYENMSIEEKNKFDKDYYSLNLSNVAECKLLIIDESSMMKDLEFKYILYICKILQIKIIFLGDKYQLPPVNEKKLDFFENKKEDLFENNENNQEQSLFNYSPAVKLKSSYTLSTIKRTNNPVLQEIYKNYRDIVEKSNQGKIKIQNIQFTKNIQPTETYLIKTRNDIHNVIKYIQTKGYYTEENSENFRILCFSNNEVNKMNCFMRNYLYGNINEKYIKDELLLVTDYMILPSFTLEQLTIIENCLDSNLQFSSKDRNILKSSKSDFNYIFNILIGEKTSTTNNNLIRTFKDFNINTDNIKLYTSCILKVIKSFDTQIYLNEKILDITVVFFSFESSISLFFYFKKDKEKEYVRNYLKSYKDKIKLSCDMFRLHSCNSNCKNENSHYCEECNDYCIIHTLNMCEKESCKNCCKECIECDNKCVLCLKLHRNNYSTALWNKFTYKEYILNPSINYSYATTVHKSQGQSIDNIVICEYNIVNCILYNNEISENEKMLIYPTCMYTAVTRAKNVLVRLK